MPERPDDAGGNGIAPVTRRNLLLRMGGGLAAASVLPAALERTAWANGDRDDGHHDDDNHHDWDDHDGDGGFGSPIVPGEGNPRTLHTMTSLGGGSFLVAGGMTDFVLSSAEIYTPGRGWQEVAPMNTARAYHAAIRLPGDRVLVLGGFGLAPLASTEIYDPRKDSWTFGPELSTPRFQHTALKDGDQILLFGGYFHSLLSSVEVLSVKAFK